MASNLLIGASSLSRQDLAQKYLETFKSRNDAYVAQLKADIATLSAGGSGDIISITSNALINKATQLVADLESIDKQSAPAFKVASNITDIINSYQDALEQFRNIGEDEDVREVLDSILQNLQSGGESSKTTLSGKSASIDEKA